tara:strand:- start:12074 stop:12676 length:603 start_codon:yes stop_codon:yes gene_type:complete
MQISDRQAGPTPALFGSAGQQQPTGVAFASMLDGERVSGAARTANTAVSESAQSAAAKKEVAYIKENGILAYIAENHKRKLEELRAEILQSMGLTEEALAEMSPQQRGLIEKAIAEEIQKRLAAEAALNGGLDDGNSTGAAMADRNATGAELVLHHKLTGDPGILAAISIGEAASRSGDVSDRGPDDRQGLPGRGGLLPD